MSNLEDEYFRVLGIQKDDKQRTEAAFARAHDIRKFEIELYWKRAGHFWLMQAAIFAAIGLSWFSQTASPNPVLPLALAGLGFLTAVGSWFSSEGSKFWQENWERHIDLLEYDYEGHLHKTVWIGRDGIRWSVSGTNGWLNIAFAAFWGFLFISEVPGSADWTKLYAYFLDAKAPFEWAALQSVGVALATMTGFVMLWSRRTRFEGTLTPIEPNLAAPRIDVWPRIVTRRKSANSILERRPRP